MANKKKKRTAADVFGDAEANGLEPAAEAGINGDRVCKPLEPGTVLNYNRMTDLWDE
jgi:hypothetical protein